MATWISWNGNGQRCPLLVLPGVASCWLTVTAVKYNYGHNKMETLSIAWSHNGLERRDRERGRGEREGETEAKQPQEQSVSARQKQRAAPATLLTLLPLYLSFSSPSPFLTLPFSLLLLVYVPLSLFIVWLKMIIIFKSCLVASLV